MKAANNSKNAVVDVVVITWDRWELSRRCLDHLFSSTIPVNVIVVDNGSQDRTPERVRALFPQATLIEFAENRGYGAAANAGAAAGSAEFVSIVNSDALLERNFFELIVENLRLNPEVGFASGLSIDPSTGLVDAAGAIFDSTLNWVPCSRSMNPDEVHVDASTLGSPPSDMIVFRRSAFSEVNGYDAEFFAYCEDIDIVLRLRNAGWKPSLVKGARAEHLGSAALGKRSLKQMELVGWGHGYVAGRYRLPFRLAPIDLALWIGICVAVRSLSPLNRVLAGWRRGRSLPPRRIPHELYRMPMRRALRERIAAARG